MKSLNYWKLRVVVCSRWLGSVVRRLLNLHSWLELPNTRKILPNGIAYRVVKHASIPNFYRVQRFVGQRWRVVDKDRVEIYEHLRFDSSLPNTKPMEG